MNPQQLEFYKSSRNPKFCESFQFRKGELPHNNKDRYSKFYQENQYSKRQTNRRATSVPSLTSIRESQIFSPSDTSSTYLIYHDTYHNASNCHSQNRGGWSKEDKLKISSTSRKTKQLKSDKQGTSEKTIMMSSTKSEHLEEVLDTGEPECDDFGTEAEEVSVSHKTEGKAKELGVLQKTLDKIKNSSDKFGGWSTDKTREKSGSSLGNFYKRVASFGKREKSAKRNADIGIDERSEDEDPVLNKRERNAIAATSVQHERGGKGVSGSGKPERSDDRLERADKREFFGGRLGSFGKREFSFDKRQISDKILNYFGNRDRSEKGIGSCDKHDRRTETLGAINERKRSDENVFSFSSPERSEENKISYRKREKSDDNESFSAFEKFLLDEQNKALGSMMGPHAPDEWRTPAYLRVMKLYKKFLERELDTRWLRRHPLHKCHLHCLPYFAICQRPCFSQPLLSSFGLQYAHWLSKFEEGCRYVDQDDIKRKLKENSWNQSRVMEEYGCRGYCNLFRRPLWSVDWKLRRMGQYHAIFNR